MKRFTALVTIMLVAGSTLWGQTKSAPDAPQGITPQANQTDSALTAETRHVFESISANILKAANQMPSSAYNFKPSDKVPTFGELVANIASIQTALCSDINNHPSKAGTQPASKDNIVKDLSRSIAECHTAFAELSAENANKLVKAPAGQITHLAALIYIITHASEHYGQLTIYLRLNDLDPPTNDKANGGGAGKAKS